MVAGGAVHQRVGGDVHQELVGALEIHSQDGEGHFHAQEGPLEGAAAEAQQWPLFLPAPDLVAVGAGEVGLTGRRVLGVVGHQVE